MIVKILSEIVMVIYNYIYSYYNNIEIIFLLCVFYTIFFFLNCHLFLKLRFFVPLHKSN